MMKNKIIILICSVVVVIFIGFMLSKRTKSESSGITWASFSPSNDNIIFSFVSSDYRGIFQMDKTGKVMKQLTNIPKDKWDFHPEYSPDGDSIVFASNRFGQDGDICLMDKEGRNIKRLTDTKEMDSYPSYSSDGKRIYFVRSKYFGNYSPLASPQFHEQDIYYVDINNDEIHQVTNERFYQISGPSIFNDPDKILMRIDGLENDSFWVVSTTNSKNRQSVRPNVDPYMPDLSRKPWATEPEKYNNFYNPILSPDNKWLIFSWAGHYQGYFGHELYIMNMKTKKTTKLTDLHTMLYPTCFSKDSNHILFITVTEDKPENQSRKSNLWLYDRINSSLLSN